MHDPASGLRKIYLPRTPVNKGMKKAGVLRGPGQGLLTKELQQHNDQPEEHHYDYDRGKRFPAHYTPPHF
jgi:hypothetical protein